MTFEEITAELLRQLRDDPELLLALTPELFERLVAERVERMGFVVKLTGKANARDGGIDFVAVPKSPSVCSFAIAGQVKHHRRADRKTGREAVDRLLAWKDSPFRLGLLVTNTDFTADARWKAAQEPDRHFARLRDRADVRRWLEDNFGSEEDAREVPREVVVAPGVTIKLPRPAFGTSFEIWPTSPEGPTAP